MKHYSDEAANEVRIALEDAAKKVEEIVKKMEE